MAKKVFDYAQTDKLVEANGILVQVSVEIIHRSPAMKQKCPDFH
jgi:hypothetical protein